MNMIDRFARRRWFLSPEHGGDAVSGGGHPADSPVPAQEAIDDALGERGRGMTPGVGVPGSQTNPVNVSREEVERRARELWEEEGQPEGRAEDHWRQAEQELRERSVSMSDIGARQ